MRRAAIRAVVALRAFGGENDRVRADERLSRLADREPDVSVRARLPCTRPPGASALRSSNGAPVAADPEPAAPASNPVPGSPDVTGTRRDGDDLDARRRRRRRVIHDDGGRRSRRGHDDGGRRHGRRRRTHDDVTSATTKRREPENQGGDEQTSHAGHTPWTAQCPATFLALRTFTFARSASVRGDVLPFRPSERNVDDAGLHTESTNLHRRVVRGLPRSSSPCS